MRIREIEESDAATVAKLTTQLGYPTTAEAMPARIEALRGKADEIVLVAETEEGRVAGWLHVRGLVGLHVEPMSEIAGMVVDEELRSQGFGAALVRAAEQWTEARGYRKMRVRSNAIRKDAHRFYERAGFAMTKTSLTFEKKW